VRPCASSSTEIAEVQRIKICGIRRLPDALAALEEGAWALGFIFHRPSPRYIEPQAARELLETLRRIASREFLAVGVFVDWPLEELQAAVDLAGLDVAQLHGQESAEYASKVRAKETWKALRVGEQFDPDSIQEWSDVDRVLLDTYRKGTPGGTGETFDWEVARTVQESPPIVLAGGLGPENVIRAIEEVGPDALDVSSGVESAPGEKDLLQLRELFARVRQAKRRP